MAGISGTKGGPDKSSRNLTVEEIVPHSAWTEEPNSHILLIDLPGFKKEDLKLEVDTHGQILASGERKVSETNYIRFEQAYRVPANSNIDHITGKFEDEILYVTVPKQIKEGKKEDDTKTTQGVEEEHAHAQELAIEHQKLENNNVSHDQESGYHDAAERNEKLETVNEGGIENEWGQESRLLDRVMETFYRNKGVLITAVLAFALGVMVVQKFQSSGGGTDAAF